MPILHALFPVLLFFFSESCTCTDIITSTQFIRDPEAIISNGTIFKLGFFSPVNTTNRYVGIVYNVSASTAIWIANRERPLNDSSGTVSISDDGNLVVLDGHQEIIWSYNIATSVANSSAQILDSGNLVLRDDSNGRIIWESFNHPVDSFVPNMRLGISINTSERHSLTSWKSAADPSPGTFSAGLVPNVLQLFVWNGNDPHWRSGPWNGQTFIGIPDMYNVYINGFRIEDDALSFKYVNESSRRHYVLTSEGNIVGRSWVDWEDTWSNHGDDCDVYGKCGSFGMCDSRKSPICTCLKGFEPKDIEEWSRGNWTGGCVRKVQLKCGRNNSISEEGKEDGFLRLETIKVPDFAEWTNAREESCGSECLRNCSCIAYTHYTGIGCMHWGGKLIDVQKFLGSDGVDLYIRVAYSELDKPRNMKVVIAITVTIGAVAIAVCAIISWKWMAHRRGEISPKYLSGSKPRVKIEELPLFTFQKLASATERFHSSNKLGQGGFGPVYRMDKK